eukprot:COSAG02_NODE_4617_length_5158_cov_85.227911_5_plen_116_part_00
MLSVGFEPTRAGSNGFQVQRLPRSAGGFPAAGLLCARQVPAMRMVAVMGAPWCHKLYNVSYCVFGSDFSAMYRSTIAGRMRSVCHDRRSLYNHRDPAHALLLVEARNYALTHHAY